MDNCRQIRWTFVIGLVLIGATAATGFHNFAPQTTQVNGKVTLKQADGTEVPGKKDKDFASGETVETAKGSSAVVSLGKLGRVEVFPESKMTLNYDNTSMTGMLSAGRVRLSTSSGVNASVSTSDARIAADTSQRNRFTVDISCGDTLVAVEKGRVELRAGDSVKQIAAGSQDTAGTATPGCRR